MGHQRADVCVMPPPPPEKCIFWMKQKLRRLFISKPDLPWGHGVSRDQGSISYILSAIFGILNADFGV